MYIRISIFVFFLCTSNTLFAQKLWVYAKENCMPADLSQRTLYIPMTADIDPKLKFDSVKVEKLFKKFYPYKYAFIAADSMQQLDSLSSNYALRKDIVIRSGSTTTTQGGGFYSTPHTAPSTGHYGGSFGTTHSSTSTYYYKAFQYRFTNANNEYSFFKTLEMYSKAPLKSLRILLKNIHYDIPANKPTHCFKINLVALIPNYSKLGLSYEFLIHRKTSLGMYVEAGSWKYNYTINSPYLSTDFILFQPQLIRYFGMFENKAYDGIFLGIAPFLFYNKDYQNTSAPDVTEATNVIQGYGIKGMIGCQFIVEKKIIVGAWGGPQYRFNAVDNYLYENPFLVSNYAPIAFTGQVFAGFVLK